MPRPNTFARAIIIAAATIALDLVLVLSANADPLQAFAWAPPVIAPAMVQPMPRDQAPDTDAADLPARLKRQVVAYNGAEAAGTIIIDTPNTYLYLVLGGGRAMRYGIGVGREGFTWAGVQAVTKKVEWPDWNPPADMINRQPYLPRFMAGGPGNPPGARAIYLGGTLYRIHGTNNPMSIGTQVSSGCIRLTNEDVTDLYARVGIGTKVIVLSTGHRADAARDRRG